jgi:hypothetical protein
MINYINVETKSEALYIISRHCGLTGEAEIRSIPELRDYLTSIWGYAPQRCGALRDLKAIACKLGIPGADGGILSYSSRSRAKIDRKDAFSPTRKTKLNRQEIIELRKQGKTLREISEIAGVSRERVRQLSKMS